MRRLPITKLTLKELIRQCNHTNVFAIDLPGYLDGKKGHPVVEPLKALLDECIGFLSMLSQAEVDQFVANLPPTSRMFVDVRDVTVDEKVFLERVALFYLVSVVQEDRLPLKQAISSDLRESRVLKAYPELRDRLDEDNLLSINASLELLDGGIEYRDHVLHYHQLLRRAYRANPNYGFLTRFARYYNSTKEKSKFRIAIDHSRLWPKAFYESVLEMDAWSGPRFDASRLDDPNAVGLTVIGRSKPSMFNTNYDLDQTQFLWSYDDKVGLKTLEIEELSSSGFCFDSYYLNRYVHAQRDVKLGSLVHFDGAVKVYLRDMYQDRLSSRKMKEPRSYNKVKLFRIDGDIDVANWIDLISFFFKGNEMIMEYFDPKGFGEKFGDEIREFQARQKE